MHARPWQEVVDFYSKSVNGQLSLLELFGTQVFFTMELKKVWIFSIEIVLFVSIQCGLAIFCCMMLKNFVCRHMMFIVMIKLKRFLMKLDY